MAKDNNSAYPLRMPLHSTMRGLTGLESAILRLVIEDNKVFRSLLGKKTDIGTVEALENFTQELEIYYAESIEKLHTLGKSFPSTIENEKRLCEKLATFEDVRGELKIDTDTNTVTCIIESPVQTFIKKYYDDFITIRKEYIREAPARLNFQTMKVVLTERQAEQLKNILVFLEEGAIRYPRLIHVALEWPLFSSMPKPPKSILDYCEKDEYEKMLNWCNRNFIRDSSFSRPETQSTTLLVYPKGESWCRESGFRRFQDLHNDLTSLVKHSWVNLLYAYSLDSFGCEMFDDGWDGLFDDDYCFNEDGWKKGFYNCYYITDVFYESVRLCRHLLDTACKKKKETKAKTDTPKTDNTNEKEMWSKPMSKVDMMLKLGFGLRGYRKLNTFSKEHPLQQIADNRQLWQIRIDKMPENLRKKFA